MLVYRTNERKDRRQPTAPRTLVLAGLGAALVGLTLAAHGGPDLAAPLALPASRSAAAPNPCTSPALTQTVRAWTPPLPPPVDDADEVRGDRALASFATTPEFRAYQDCVQGRLPTPPLRSGGTEDDSPG